MKQKVIVLLAVGFMAANVTRAQEDSAFKNTLSAGVTLTDGNSDTLQANVSLVTEGEKEGLGSVRAGVEANYGEATVNEEKDTTVNNVRAFANAKRTLSESTFGYLDGSLLHDDVAEIDYRLTFGPGVGVYLLKDEETSFSVEAGPTYIWEEVAGVSDDYLALRFAARLDHALSETAKIWQATEYLPTADDFGDYLLNAELGVEAAMTTRMNLRLVLQNKHDSTPGEGLEKNDLVLIGGVSVSL